MTTRYVGERIRRNEDPLLLTGRALFVDDVQLPGMLHVAFVRSPWAHARLTRVDATRARAHPGVTAVYTAADIGALWSPGPLLVPPPPIPGLVFHLRTQVPLARDIVRCVGEPIAMIVAESRYVAEDAADVADAKQRGYAGPLERLLTLGALPRGSIVAHGVHLTEAQVRAADEAGLWLVQNPRSNAGNRVGYARALDVSQHVAMGTDGYPADMRAERAALREESAKAGHALGHDTVVARARGGHALASSLFGVRLEPELALGSAADVVAWRGEQVVHAVVDGEVVVEDGRLIRGDLDAIRARAREQAPRLWQRMKEQA